jgi:transposase
MTDKEWVIIGGLLPPGRGRRTPPARDLRRFLAGMLYAPRLGCPSRDMHERYGKWSWAYVRVRRPSKIPGMRCGVGTSRHRGSLTRAAWLLTGAAVK